MTQPNRPDLDAALDEMAEATDRLLATVDGLDDADRRKPSLLPGWTRGHVLTHLARNADGMVNLVQWARTGEETPMYAGGRAGRDADIEAGALRHIGDVRLDLGDSAERLLGAFADFPAEALPREVRLGSGAAAYGGELPLLRVREIEIHHVDLDAGYSPAHWAPGFVRRTLDQLAPLFRDDRDCPVGQLAATDTDGRWQVAAAGPVLSGPQSALLAWLTGRSGGDGLHLDSDSDSDSDSEGAVPAAPRWA
ncbi:MAG: maleylpyruvate isomerase family mycothiol-dependent enzyme [Acidimicrobiales bacterium]